MREQNSILYEWPDLAFHQYCLQVYHLNRGTYNAIDQWLFENGYPGIKRRRKMIIAFLDHAARQKAAEGGKFLTFGKGNLVVTLSRFAASQAEAETHAGTVLAAY